MAEAPPPPGLLAELWVGNPRLFWERSRPLGGAASGLLPARLPLVLVTALGLPPDAATGFDDQVPVVGVVLGGASNEVVLGLHVTSGPELVASLTTGSKARFRAQLRPPRLTVLEAVPPASAGPALGVSGNYLLLAERSEAIVAAGRYVAESVPRHAKSDPSLEFHTKEGVLGGPIVTALRSAWRTKRESLQAKAREERATRGRPADFGDPAALLEGADAVVESWLGVLESSREMTVRIAPEADRLRVEASLSPSGDGAAELLRRELLVGDAAPLFSLPASTRAAISFHEGPSTKQAGVSGSAFVGLLGERVTEAEAARISQALEQLRALRNGATTLGLTAEPALALLITADLGDSAQLTPVLKDNLSLLELPPVSAWLSGIWGKPTFSLAPGSSAEKGRGRLRFANKGKTQLPSELQLAWEAGLGRGLALVTAAGDAERGLRELRAEPPLASSGWLSESQRYLGTRTALSLFLDARLLGVTGGSPFVVLGFGKEDTRIVLLGDFAPAALSALVAAFALNR